MVRRDHAPDPGTGFAVIASYLGSLVFTGYVQIFLVNGITHEIFLGTPEVHRRRLDFKAQRTPSALVEGISSGSKCNSALKMVALGRGE
jgi:hypothetical protein